MPRRTDDDVVPFAYVHAIKWYPRAGYGKIDGREGKLSQTGHVALRTASRADAPVAFSLERPDGGGTLDLRVIDGVLHRPLRSPGSWDPCDLRTFAEALATPRPWRDSPVFPVVGPESTCRAPLDGVGTLDGYRDEARKLEPHGHFQEAALAVAQAALGGLVVVDDVVMTPTDEPVLVIGMQGQRNGPIRVDWDLGAYGSQDDPVLGREPVPAQTYGSGNAPKPTREAVRNPFGLGARVAPGDVEAHAATFSADRSDDAVAFARAVADAIGAPTGEANLVTYADPSRVSRRDRYDLSLRMLRRAWDAHAVGSTWARLLSGPDEGVAAWMAARRAVQSLGTDPDPARVAEVMDGMCDLVDRVEFKRYDKAHVGMLRWRAADGRCDPSLLLGGVAPDADDEVATLTF